MTHGAGTRGNSQTGKDGGGKKEAGVVSGVNLAREGSGTNLMALSARLRSSLLSLG